MRSLRRLKTALALALGVSACSAPSVGDTPAGAGQVAPGEATRYLTDRAWRREVLEDALWRPELPYSRSLLSAYALPEGGWDLLPLQSPLTAPFTRADADALARGEALGLEDARAFVVPADPDATDATDTALGAEVFARLPMRADGWLDWLAGRPDLWTEAGFSVNGDGAVRGLVRFADTEGRVRVGLTCAGCHAGDDVPGRGDRQLNLGRARALYAAERGLDADTLNTWGPGRVDVTDTDSDDPTAIPDLFHVGQATHLNHSGVVQVTSRSTLAVRFETQFVQGHRMRARPERRLMWALASFVASLGEGEDPAVSVGEVPASFAARCAGCHDPRRAFGGDLVDADTLAVDPAVALDPERGTGAYRVPTLRGVWRNAPYLHDGSQPDLASLLAAGHPRGDVLPAAERAEILRFLHTL